MRTQGLFLVILLSLLASSPVKASDWVLISSNKDFTAYVDKQSIIGNTNSKKFWAQQIFKKEERSFVTGKYYIEVKSHLEIDCNNNIMKIHELIFYSNEGKVIDSFN